MRTRLLLGFLPLGVLASCGDCESGEKIPPRAIDGDSADALEPAGDASADAADDAIDDDDRDSGLARATAPLTFRLKTGNEVPGDRPNAWAYLPSRFDARKPLHVMVLFHGFRNCIYSYTAKDGGRPCVPMGPRRTGYDIAGQAERAKSGAIMVVPEISFNADTSDPEKLGQRGALSAFLRELIDDALAPYVGPHRSGDVERLALAASSGGYQALLPILETGGAHPTDLYFFDALYVYPTGALGSFLWSDVSDFDPKNPKGKRFGVIYTDNGGALETSQLTEKRLQAWLEDAGHSEWGEFRADDEPTADDMRAPIAMVFSRSEHDKIMHRDLGALLEASGL